jgi:hypothetical protein
LAVVFFVWAKLTLGALWGEVIDIAKRKFVLSASLRSTYTSRVTPSLRVTLAPKLIGASLKTICGLNTSLVFSEATSLYRRVARKEKECGGQEEYHCIGRVKEKVKMTAKRLYNH